MPLHPRPLQKKRLRARDFASRFEYLHRHLGAHRNDEWDEYHALKRQFPQLMRMLSQKKK